MDLRACCQKQSLTEMRRPVYIADDWSSGQGLGWRAVRKGDHVFWNHGGAVHGFSTSVFFNVPTKTGVILVGEHVAGLMER